jgi:uncharacterized protein (TIGR03083 family)
VSTTQQATKKSPRCLALDRDVAMRLARTEYERVVSLLERLTPEQWDAPTDCPGWDVRAMAGHVVGMAQMAASLPEMARQQVSSLRRAKRDGGLTIDALTALQVEKNAGLTTAELVAAMRRAGPKAAKGRRRTPGFVRGRTVPEAQDVAGDTEWWTFGYLLDVILTRDPFMHRIDISVATGLPLQATADHEGLIIDDVVREWAGRHGAPYTLELSGPAGGRWSHGDGPGETLSLDAFEFCRTISGRLPAAGMLAVQVPF